jgi:hypothetical protein
MGVKLAKREDEKMKYGGGFLERDTTKSVPRVNIPTSREHRQFSVLPWERPKERRLKESARS